MPTISKSTIRHRYKSGNHFVQIHTDITSIGAVLYAHLAVVFADLKQEPVFFVSSEINEPQKDETGNSLRTSDGSHFLCTFDEKGHHNLGCDNKWADFDVFVREALKIINRRYDPIFSAEHGAENPL